jgi:hypothetical protein
MGDKILIPRDLGIRSKKAALSFWDTREGQISRHGEKDGLVQGDRVAVDVSALGNRGAAVGGKQMDGFMGLIKEILIVNKVPEKSIFTNLKL